MDCPIFSGTPYYLGDISETRKVRGQGSRAIAKNTILEWSVNEYRL